MTWAGRPRWTSVVRGRAHMKMVTGQLAALTAQVAGLMNVKPVLTLRKSTKRRLDTDLVAFLKKERLSFYTSLSRKHGNSGSGSHLLQDGQSCLLLCCPCLAESAKCL